MAIMIKKAISFLDWQLLKHDESIFPDCNYSIWVVSTHVSCLKQSNLHCYHYKCFGYVYIPRYYTLKNLRNGGTCKYILCNCIFLIFSKHKKMKCMVNMIPMQMKLFKLSYVLHFCYYPDSTVHGANLGPTWVLSAPDGPHVGPMNLAIRVVIQYCSLIFVDLIWWPHFHHWQSFPHLSSPKGGFTICDKHPKSVLMKFLFSLVCLHGDASIVWLVLEIRWWCHINDMEP